MSNKFDLLEEATDEEVPVKEAVEKMNQILHDTAKEVQSKLPKTQRNVNRKCEIEFIEMRKLTRRKIREDISKYNEKLIGEVIERNKSLKKAQKTITNGQRWIRCEEKERQRNNE